MTMTDLASSTLASAFSSAEYVELTQEEQTQIDGGLIPLLLIGGLLLLSGCRLSEEAAGHHRH